MKQVGETGMAPGVKKEMEEIVSCLLPYEPRQVILFGSFARGDWHTHSDVDILVVKETPASFSDRIGEVLELCAAHPRVQPLVYTPGEIQEMLGRGNDFLTTVLAEGVLLYEQPER